MRSKPNHTSKPLSILLRRRRGAVGLSIARVAREMGISHQLWSAYESDKCSLPPKRIAKIASVLQIRPAILKSYAFDHYTKTRQRSYAARMRSAS